MPVPRRGGHTLGRTQKTQATRATLCDDGRKVHAPLELEGVSVELGQTTVQIASPAEDVGLCDSILLF